MQTNELPESLIRVLKLAEGHVRVDEVEKMPEPMRLAAKHAVNTGLATIVETKGPEPPQPGKSLKPVRDLRPGDIIALDGRGYRVEWVADSPMGSIPSGIDVQCEGSPVWTYGFNAKVEVFDGPIPVCERWKEYILNAPGVNALNLYRLKASPLEAESEGEQPDKSPPAGMTWQEAAQRMERLRSQGEKFSSQHELAKMFGCSSGTIHKAIQQTKSLHGWAYRKAAPRAQSMNEVVTAQASQSGEPDPADEAAIREYLEREDLMPDERAFFNGLSRENQLDFLDDPDKHSLEQQPRILGRKP